VDEETNLSCLKSRPNQEVKIRNSMFHPRQPTEEPAFFTFNSHADINRLAQLIGKNIVIHFTNESWNFFEIYHDFRAFNNNLVSVNLDKEEDGNDDNDNDDDKGSSSQKWKIMRARNKAEKIGVFDALTASRKLYKFDQCLDDLLDTSCPFFASEFWRMRINHSEDDYGVLLSQVVVYIVVRPAEIIVRKKGIFVMRERELLFLQTRPDR